MNYAYTLSGNKESFTASGNLKSRKITRQELQRDDSDIDVIIFKFAIAIGWNIPRACILSQYRNIKSNNLKIQTIGWILRNIFVGDEENFNKLSEDEKNEVLTCYLYSAHQSAKQYETSVLKLKDKFKNEKVKKTFQSQTSKNDEGVGYVKKYEKELINDYISLFNKKLKNIAINDLLNSNHNLEIKFSKTIFSGKVSVDRMNVSLINQGQIGRHTIIWLDKIISNKFELDREFNNWIQRNSPLLKNIFIKVFDKLKYNDSTLYKSKILRDVDFGKEILAIKRRYQTLSEKDETQTMYDLKIKEINLPIVQLSNNPRENVLDIGIRHLSNILTTTIDGENKLFFNSDPNTASNNSPERKFLEDLDLFVEKSPDFLKFIHRNERNKECISYLYYDENEKKHVQYPDYILRTEKGTTIICEIKTINGGLDYLNSVKNIENGIL